MLASLSPLSLYLSPTLLPSLSEIPKYYVIVLLRLSPAFHIFTYLKIFIIYLNVPKDVISIVW